MQCTCDQGQLNQGLKMSCQRSYHETRLSAQCQLV